MKTLASKILVAVAIGVASALIEYFDLIRRLPGFYCEGFGCIGLVLVYLIYLPIISLLIIGFLTYFTNKENKVKHVFVSLGIMIIVLLLNFSTLTILNDRRNEKAITASKQNYAIFYNQIENEASEIVRQNYELGPIGYVEKKYADKPKQQEILFELVRQLEKITETNDINKIDRLEYSRVINCMINNHANELMVLEMFIFDTEQKRAKFKQFNTARPGHSAAWDFLDNVDCDFK